ncbi:MAG: L-asparaginase [Frankiales bacterium]|nr:L-asparaginase [Frankiales bacterium]
MIALTSGEPLVEVTRGGIVESLHTGHVVVIVADGIVLAEQGQPRQPVFARSALKPVQAVGLLRSGVELSASELALAASSHSGSNQHLNLIQAELTAAGLTEQDLECPPALPLGPAEQRDYLAAGRTERRLAMNCSGQHTAMLRACLHNNWPVSGYLDPAHPLQQLLAATASELADEPISAIGVDGCGAPTFAISLIGLARAFSRIGRARHQGADAQSPAEHRVATAMREFPQLVGGTGRRNTVLMSTVAGAIVKDGAEGVYAAALPDGGALALKIDDGSSRAADVAIVAALRRLGVPDASLAELERIPVFTGAREVGEIRAVRL